MQYDKLLMYLGEDLVLSDDIVIHQPSIIDIARFGEKKYFNVVNTICAIPSDFKSELWDMGIDYCKISDFECFILLSRNIDYDDLKLLFPYGFSFKAMAPAVDQESSGIVMINPEKNIVLTEEIYKSMIGYIREMHYIKPKVEKAANKETKKILIDEDRMIKLRRRKEKNDNDSFLLPLISSMVNSPGFKYNVKELRDLGIYQFIDSVKRIETITTAISIMNGMYSGFVDISKNQKLIKQLNWLRDLSNEYSNKTNVTVTNH